MNNKPIIVEKLLDAPVEKVWAAITDKEEMSKWYFEHKEFRAEPGFKFSFVGQGHEGQEYIHLCNITEVIPQKKLQHTWEYKGYDGSSLLTFELTPEGDKTRLLLTHRGVETFPQNSPDFAKESFNAGWNEIINVLLPKYLKEN